VRKFKITVPAPTKLLRSEQQNKGTIDYDLQWVEGAVWSDLDEVLLEKLVHQHNSDISAEQMLTQLELVWKSEQGWKISRAALLLFAKEIQRWHPRSHVRIIKVDGVDLLSGDQYNVVSDEFVQANLMELPSKAWAWLQPHLLRPTADYSGHEWMYPEVVCKELLMNAIVHRDYSNNSSIEIIVFDDRIELNNPGVPLVDLSEKVTDNLLPTFQARNRKIVETLRLMGVLQGAGKGFIFIWNELKGNDLPLPKIEKKAITCSITLYNKCEFSFAQQLFLRQFEQFPLSIMEKKVLVAGMNDKELSPSDINKVLNTEDREICQSIVDSLRDTGLLIQFRSKMQARSIAFKLQQDKLQIPRFKVALPARYN
jgi:ATP-dependent DNA helicase RecG